MSTDADALVGEWRTEMRRRGVLPSSIEARLIHLRAIARDHDPMSLTTDELEEWLDNRKGRGGGRISDRTRYCYLSNLSAFYEWARRAGVCDIDPAKDVIRPRLRPGLPRPIRDDLLERAIHGADDRMRVWIKLAAFAGLRVAEIAGLTRTDILDLHDPWHLHVVGKGRKERYVPVHPKLRSALQTYGIPRSGPLFTSSTGRMYTGARVSALMCRHLDRLDIDDRPHALRHWFASEALEASDGNIRVVQELLGHSSLVTTSIYTKLRPEHAVDVVARISL